MNNSFPEYVKILKEFHIKKAREAENIKKQQKCSWSEVAKYMGVSRQTIFNWRVVLKEVQNART